MDALLHTFRAIYGAIYRGVFLYLSFYAYIFVLVPLTVAFDSWSPIPIWGWMGLYSAGVFLIELSREWPEERIDPVTLVGPSVCAQPSGGRVVHLRRGRLRTARAVVGVMTPIPSPLHRQLRFGRTRIR